MVVDEVAVSLAQKVARSGSLGKRDNLRIKNPIVNRYRRNFSEHFRVSVIAVGQLGKWGRDQPLGGADRGLNSEHFADQAEFPALAWLTPGLLTNV